MIGWIPIQTQRFSPTSLKPLFFFETLKPYYLEISSLHQPSQISSLRLQEVSNNPSNIMALWNGLVHGLDPMKFGLDNAKKKMRAVRLVGDTFSLTKPCLFGNR